MTHKKLFWFVSILLLFTSCSSTKLMDSWKSPSFDSLSSAKILVVSDHPDIDVRKSYEAAIVKKLRSKNIDAVEANLQFPSLEKAETQESTTKILKEFKEAEISAIILTSLKQTIETQNGPIYSQKGIPEAYAAKMNFGSNANFSKLPSVSTSKTYVLEAITYNLALEGDKQLVNVCLVDVTDPGSEDEILKSFTKIIGNQFE